jgi:hypothetical protein
MLRHSKAAVLPKSTLERTADPTTDDLERARRINDRIHPTIEVLYADPFVLEMAA